MKRLTFLFLFFVSFSSFAFDYHGIKSGMTDQQVKSFVKCEYVSRCDNEETERFFGGEDNVPPALWNMQFSYTNDHRLWRISLRFREKSGTVGAAQLKALGELYPDVELQNTTQRIGGSSSYAFDIDVLVALLIDIDLFQEDVAKIYRETIDKY